MIRKQNILIAQIACRNEDRKMKIMQFFLTMPFL